MSLPSHHKDLPVTTTICVHARRCTRSLPYLFVFILAFKLTVKIYPSTVLLFYMYTDVPVHHYTCTVSFFFFGITCTRTLQLIYWGTYPQIHPKINLPVYLHASISSNHKDLPYTTTAMYLPIHITVHDHTCSFSYFNSDEPLRSTRHRFYCAATPCLPVYLHASLSSNHKELPVTTTTCVRTHRCTVHDPTC